MVTDHLFREGQIGVEQGLGCAFHSYTRHPAHIGQLIVQGGELRAIGGPHGRSVWVPKATTTDGD